MPKYIISSESRHLICVVYWLYKVGWHSFSIDKSLILSDGNQTTITKIFYTLLRTSDSLIPTTHSLIVNIIEFIVYNLLFKRSSFIYCKSCWLIVRSSFAVCKSCSFSVRTSFIYCKFVHWLCEVRLSMSPPILTYIHSL